MTTQKMPTDLEICQAAKLEPVTKLADKLGITKGELEVFGKDKAKVKVEIFERLSKPVEKYDLAHSPMVKPSPKKANYVLVTGINPTPLGEGKTTTMIGLCQALQTGFKKKVVTCIREPSQGPTFGIKGGGAGGGYSQVVPMEELNLHLTGDFHAVSQANNLIAAALDTRIYHEETQTDSQLFNRLYPMNKKTKTRTISAGLKFRIKSLGLDEETIRNAEKYSEDFAKLVRLDLDYDQIYWKRVEDILDRSLREITINQAKTEAKGKTRSTGFDITSASELMAIIAMCDSFEDMRARIGRILLGFSKSGEQVTCNDLGITNAAALVMRETVKPTLVQTLENSPVFVHSGPFANIAHGNSSIIADKIAMKLVESENGFCVTEAGFGADIGMEKFFNIKCRASGLVPDVIVLVVTIRALKMHGGGPKVVGGKALAPEYTEEKLDMVEAGCPLMEHHIKNALKYNTPVVVAINSFPSDTEAEVKLVEARAKAAGAVQAVSCTNFAHGSGGAMVLAGAVVDLCPPLITPTTKTGTYLYDLKLPIVEKLEIIAKEMYGATGVELSERAQEQVKKLTDCGYGELPICVAKTAASLTGDPSITGVPEDFVINVREVKVSAGAGFVLCLVGNMMTMPGMPTKPNYLDIDIVDGKVVGLS